MPLNTDARSYQRAAEHLRIQINMPLNGPLIIYRQTVKSILRRQLRDNGLKLIN